MGKYGQKKKVENIKFHRNHIKLKFNRKIPLTRSWEKYD